MFGLFIALSSTAISTDAFAKSNSFHHRQYSNFRHARHRFAGAAPHVIQCVAFAKQDAGIMLSGNARDWWYNAEGLYERGHAPEQGSVLAFTANGRMPLGHVAVVSSVVDSRTITIDQAHWQSRGVTRDIEVKDVSEDNDWSAVRVEMGHGDTFGSIYPTHGFIYGRPDSGHIVEAAVHAPMPNLDPAPADLRHTYHERHASQVEVAEFAPTTRGLDLSLPGIGSDAPDRAFQ
jgi:surface antigen